MLLGHSVYLLDSKGLFIMLFFFGVVAGMLLDGVFGGCQVVIYYSYENEPWFYNK